MTTNKPYHIDITVSRGDYPHIQACPELGRHITITPETLKAFWEGRLSLKENLEAIVVSLLT